MDHKKLWKTAQESLKISVSSANYCTWFAPTFIHQIKPVGKDRQIVEIACPSDFVRNMVENRYYALIKDALDKITEKKNDLVFIIKQAANGSAKKNNGPLFAKKTKPAGPPQKAIRTAGLRPDFTFESFAVSSSNQMAHAAATAVAQNPGSAYNPLFLYGGVGVGKTHLAQATAFELLKAKPNAKVIYCMGEDFTNEIIDAIRTKTTKEFRQKFRTVHFLLIDDIQFIAGKSSVQEEFFHTFNALERKGGQIVLTSDRRPDEITGLEDRLRSRFEGGLMVDIQQPNFELRTAILLIKAQQYKINLPMDVAQLIAGNITSTRKLEGFLIRMSQEAKLKSESITPGFVNALLGKVGDSANGEAPKRLVKPKEILRAVAGHFNLKISEITGKCRAKPIVVPRQIAMYLLRIEQGLPLMEVGRLLGGRDHTTIMHGVEKITSLMPESEDIRVDIAGIKQKLYG